MADLLFSSADRDEAHVKLEEQLASGSYPRAECREDPNLPEPYQVWSGPQDAVEAPPLTDEEKAQLVAAQITHPTIIDAIASRVAEKLAERA